MRHGHFQPFEVDAGFPDRLGDRSALMEEVGKLRRHVYELERELASARHERDRYKDLAQKRWWHR